MGQAVTNQSFFDLRRKKKAGDTDLVALMAPEFPIKSIISAVES